MTVLDSSPSEAGGFKSIEFKVEGDKVYSVMKYESGVHRVQRVPKTESQGRIQTSTATVAVLPEAEEIDVQINQSDLRIDTYCASGPGGQCVNTTYSAVRVATCPPTPWCSLRSSALRSRTARSACRCCAPVCTRWSLSASRQSWVPSAPARLATATVIGRSSYL